MSEAQTPEEALGALKEMSSVFAEKSFTLAEMVATTALVIALFFVVYEVTSKRPHAKEYTIAWFIGVILYVIFLTR